MKKSLSKIASILLLPAVAFMITSCAKAQTTVRLRPDLTTDDTEIWEIYGQGYDPNWGSMASLSMNDVYKAILRRAADLSESEGYDCFIVVKDVEDVKTYSGSITTKETMHGSSNYSANYGANTDYYNNYGYNLGSSRTNGTMYGRSDYSYQVPVTQEYSFSVPEAAWYVILEESEKCSNLRKSKWRENVWFNSEIPQK